MLIFKARKAQQLPVTERQFQILLGTILGDGYMTKRGQVEIEQSEKKREYLFWKHKELASISYSGISTVTRADDRYSRSTVSLRFSTRQFFRSIRPLFYEGGRKVIKEELIERLQPLALAVWYMDDGCLDREAYLLSVPSYPREGVERIQRYFKERFGIDTTYRKDGKIRIRNKDTRKFTELITPHIVPSMTYKVALTP